MLSSQPLEAPRIMSTKKLDKAYISEIDKFLHALDNKFANTESQNAEIKKNQRIAHLRDKAGNTKTNQGSIWEDF